LLWSFAALLPSTKLDAAEAIFAGKPTADTPTATVMPGKPPRLDFGDGLQIACDKSAFLTLWEGKIFWLTFGAGRSSYTQQAQGQAVKYASAAMKLLLMTLALAPDRMTAKDGGWRLKPDEAHHFVLGDITLPGHPYWPINDTALGFGNKDDASLGGPITSGPSVTGSAAAPTVDPTQSFDKSNAFTCYIVLKKDLSLEDVRKRAQVLVE
jgi:hypothetical protein